MNKDMQISDEVRKRLEEGKNILLKVSIMGQTGVGKSSLLNALCITQLGTDRIRPCTKEIERVVTRGLSNHELWFYDLPGIGEAVSLTIQERCLLAFSASSNFFTGSPQKAKLYWYAMLQNSSVSNCFLQRTDQLSINFAVVAITGVFRSLSSSVPRLVEKDPPLQREQQPLSHSTDLRVS
jgi:ABC-type uncharacterized transport system ATPase component